MRGLGVEFAGVLVVVAVETEQLPVAAVLGVVVVVVVTVVHGQFAQVFAGEFAGTTATDPGIDLQSLFAVTGFARLPVADRLGDHSVGVGAFCGISVHVLYSCLSVVPEQLLTIFPGLIR